MSTLGAHDLEMMKARAPEVAELLRLVSTPTRLLLLCHIAQGEPTVSELERDLGLRQPGLSQQLAELRRNGLVSTRRVSRSIHYSIADARTRALLGALHAIFCTDAVTLPATPAADSDATTPRPQQQAARFAKVAAR